MKLHEIAYQYRQVDQYSLGRQNHGASMIYRDMEIVYAAETIPDELRGMAKQIMSVIHDGSDVEQDAANINSIIDKMKEFARNNNVDHHWFGPHAYESWRKWLWEMR